MPERKAGVSVGSRELLGLVFEHGSFRSWDAEAGPPPAFADTERYRAELAAARARAGVDEAVVTGEGRIGGRRVAVACGEFAFLAGSIGVASARRLVAAIERATRERLPMLAVTASGGTRMQEGAPAFLRMAGIAAAVAEHKRAGLPYLVYLRHPTTGGVLASWGSLGHVTLAEPGALIGFLGPKVYLALHGRPFPEGVQTSTNLRQHGLVDAVLPPEQLAGTVGRILDLLDSDAAVPAEVEVARPGAVGRDGAPDDVTAWTSITRSRDGRRPGVWELLSADGVDALPLAGAALPPGVAYGCAEQRDGAVGSGDGHGLLLALARIGGTNCVLVGQDRRAQARHPLGPDALRLARRGMRLAAELGLPLVTVIDTPGAALSVPAEEGGLAGEIAHCLAELVTLPVPTVSVLLGQGAGGAALALLPADRVIAARHGWLAPLPPEGASAIVHHRPDRAAEVAAAQRVTSADLLRDGAVDTLVDEHPDAAEEPAAFVRRLATEVAAALRDLAASPAEHRLASRQQRYRDHPR